MNPKVRKKAINNLMMLYYDAPELKISIQSKLDQLSGDADETVANYAKRMLDRVKSGRTYRPYYSPGDSRPTSAGTSTDATRGTSQAPREVKNIIANVICCVVMIVIYFIVSYVI